MKKQENTGGVKVQLKPACAKFYLENPEIYFSQNGYASAKYEEETQLHLVCCMGEPVYGTLVEMGRSGFFLAEFKVGPYKAKYYVEKKSIIVL